MLQQVTQLGAFTNSTANIINSNFAAITNPDLWVRPQYGNNASATGTYEKAFSTVAGALSSPLLKPGMSIGLLGVTTEEVTAPIVNDITIIGMGNWPRQATTSGAPNGGGATWLSPSGGSGTLLTVQGQANTVKNIYFNNSATGATTACLKVLTTGDPPTSADAAHILVQNCIFTGGNFGVYVSGGTNFVNLDGNTFFNFTGSGDTAVANVTGAGVGTLWGWRVTNNYVYDCVNGIKVPTTQSFFIGNTFVYAGKVVTATTLLSLTGGTGNIIYNNKFGLASNAGSVGTICAYGTTPSAGPNFYSDVTEYDQPS